MTHPNAVFGENTEPQIAPNSNTSTLRGSLPPSLCAIEMYFVQLEDKKDSSFPIYHVQYLNTAQLMFIVIIQCNIILKCLLRFSTLNHFLLYATTTLYYLAMSDILIIIVPTDSNGSGLIDF